MRSGAIFAVAIRNWQPSCAARLREDMSSGTNRNTLRVHPSNRAGICDALDLLDSYRLGEMPISRPGGEDPSPELGDGG